MNPSIILNNRKSQLARKIVHKSRVRLPPRDQRSSVHSSNSSSFHVQSLVQNYCNFKNSDAPARLMYRDDDSWVDYEISVVEAVRNCFVMKNPMVEVIIGGVLCLFDFYRMLVFDFEAQFEKSVAWIDVNGNCFFPKFVIGGVDDEFSSFTDGLGKLEIEIRVSDGELSNKRKRECEEEVKSVESCSNVNAIKKRREVVSEEMESMRWMKARLLEGGNMYSVVHNLFLNWVGIKGIGAEITGIHQVTRTTAVDRARYEGFLNQVKVTKAARGHANVAFAWIKCSSEGVDRILNHGFSNPAKSPLGEAFGVGIYLSPVKSTRVR